MTIDFHDEKNRRSYASRSASTGWMEAVCALVRPEGKRVVDIGCGGGIYSRAWADLGASRVIGIDFSPVMLGAAEEHCRSYGSISFHLGDALETGLPDGCADFVFARALIHHLQNLPAFFAEAKRLLVPGGICIVQDRTPEDVRLPGSAGHIRGFFFDCFPRLLAVEEARRPSDAVVRGAMEGAGFVRIQSQPLWEVRREFETADELAADLAARTGRSILHELSDDELHHLIAYIMARIPRDQPITDADRWTIWTGEKPS
jgi:ubiquinone/menaquinone biosynthesis C-methylase UbiE